MTKSSLCAPLLISMAMFAIPALAGDGHSTVRDTDDGKITFISDAKPDTPGSRIDDPDSTMMQTVGARFITLTAIDAPVPNPPAGFEGKGLCKVTFGLTRAGTTRDVEVNCPSARYGRIIQQAARDWTYEPIEVSGRIREADDVRMTIRYDIQREVR